MGKYALKLQNVWKRLVRTLITCLKNDFDTTFACMFRKVHFIIYILLITLAFIALSYPFSPTYVGGNNFSYFSGLGDFQYRLYL